MGSFKTTTVLCLIGTALSIALLVRGRIVYGLILLPVTILWWGFNWVTRERPSSEHNDAPRVRFEQFGSTEVNKASRRPGGLRIPTSSIGPAVKLTCPKTGRATFAFRLVGDETLDDYHFSDGPSFITCSHCGERHVLRKEDLFVEDST